MLRSTLSVVAPDRRSRGTIRRRSVTTVIQPPSVNFSRVVTARMLRHSTSPMPWMASWRFQRGSLRALRDQWRAMPSWVSEKVMKTLIEYITTSVVMSPRV